MKGGLILELEELLQVAIKNLLPRELQQNTILRNTILGVSTERPAFFFLHYQQNCYHFDEREHFLQERV